MGQPDTNPIVALAQARRLIEELQAEAARVEELEVEVALLRNGHANGHSEVTIGEGEPPSTPPSDSYGTAPEGRSHEAHGAIGHSEVLNGPPQNSSEEASHSYEISRNKPSLEKAQSSQELRRTGCRSMPPPLPFGQTHLASNRFPSQTAISLPLSFPGRAG